MTTFDPGEFFHYGANAAAKPGLFHPFLECLPHRVGEEGDELELIARAVAQRAWVEPRVRDWIQLAPTLGVRPGAGVRTVLLCPSFRHETEAAAAALGDQSVSLARYRCLSNGGNLEILIEPITRAVALRPTPPRPDQSGRPAFRTGLNHEDLGLTAEEYVEFE